MLLIAKGCAILTGDLFAEIWGLPAVTLDFVVALTEPVRFSCSTQLSSETLVLAVSG